MHFSAFHVSSRSVVLFSLVELSVMLLVYFYNHMYVDVADD